MEKAYGSGYFGDWIEDDFGLPAYRYTCDQNTDPKAQTPVNLHHRMPTDHSHQVGNDRLVAVASNYGYVQVRQDEGSPKFLNDFDPEQNHYAGGFGYLTDGHDGLSTYYSGTAESFERIFGVGYYRKIVKNAGYQADQVIFAPFGDDPIILSQVTITNQRQAAVDLRWVEYWGCRMYQFSYRAQIMAVIRRGKQHAPELRRQLSQRFSQHFEALEKQPGLLNTKKFLGFTRREKLAWAGVQVLLATLGRSFTGGAIKFPVKQASLEDFTPPPTFLVSLDGPASGLASDEQAFFGNGGIEKPDGLATPLLKANLIPEQGSAMFLERSLRLEPGERKTLSFAYGYLPEGFKLDELLSRYQDNVANLWAESSAAWKSDRHDPPDRIHLEIPGEPWVDRELTWHNYYLRSNLTYDSFFKEHILSQGHVYQYIIGFQGAARDPLQHALPFLFTQPEIVKEVLRYTLKEVQPDGEIPYGIVGHGMRMAAPYRPSDLEMWLLWLASEYVMASRDREFLDEVLPTYPLYGPSSQGLREGRETVRALLTRCFHHLTQITGVGQHGLLRLSNGDWNDAAVIDFVPAKQIPEVRKVGESVLNAAFATYALEIYADLLSYIGDHPQEEEARHFAEAQRQAVRQQWTGQWFRREWLSDSLGWVGEDILWLEPQPWAIIGGAATQEQTQTLLQNIDSLVRHPSPIGARLHSQGVPQMRMKPGDLVNGGVWPSINGTLIWALALVDGERAWEEWRKNTLAQHAEAYPEVWYGIWSGPDAYNSELSKYPGQTYFDEAALQSGSESGPLGVNINWTDFPVLNMHPHAWPLYDAARLMGIQFTPQGVRLAPCLPQPTYRFASPLLGIEKSATSYQGWYAPGRPGTWQITLQLPPSERERYTHLEVNQRSQPFQRTPQGEVTWKGESTPDQPMQWVLS